MTSHSSIVVLLALLSVGGCGDTGPTLDLGDDGPARGPSGSEATASSDGSMSTGSTAARDGETPAPVEMDAAQPKPVDGAELAADSGLLAVDADEPASCLSNSNCPQDEPFCSGELGDCVECLEDAHCIDPDRPFCNGEECVECMEDGHCPDAGVCDDGSCSS